MRSTAIIFLVALLAVAAVHAAPHLSALAATEEELKAQIDDRAKRITDLEAEIAKIETDLNATTKEKQTLQSTIKTIDLSRTKVSTNINLTQTKIQKTDLEISGLAEDISDTDTKIRRQRTAIYSSLSALSELEDGGLAVSIFSGEDLSTFFAAAASMATLRDSLRDQVAELSGLKVDLQESKSSAEQKRSQLAALKADLADQKYLLDQNRKEKDALLATTKNKEANYQKLLEEKRALKMEFEADLREFENRLNLTIDPNSIPKYGSGVLKWPVDKVVITQNFGNTAFSTQNPQIYSGRGHNGIDLGIATGNKIRAARGGTIKGTGDTDVTCPNASYGKWVLVEHDNGLSTLYAHLSYIRVGKGSTVETGEVLGYSGNTGYSTGPHLHFTVYATQGVEIRSFASQSCKGKSYTMPVADTKAYLNPLSYLP